MYSVFNATILFRIFALSVCTGLSACDYSKNSNQQDSAHTENMSVKHVAADSVQHEAIQSGKKLTEVAGQATLPTAAEVNDLDQPEISREAQAFVGRYHTQISCIDPFAMCDQGSSEFIINLLPDGTAHRTFVYMGKMTYEKNEIKSNRSYQKNTWIYDEKNHEIIINRIEGIKFFYHVDAEKNLVMDVDQILNATEENKQYFKQNNIAPTKAYVLKRFDN